VVGVREAASRPAQVGDIECAKGLDDIETQAALVRDRGILAHPESAVDAAAEVLGEVAVQVLADRRTGDVEIDDHVSAGRGHAVPPIAETFGSVVRGEVASQGEV
jgi:hypothetical protein